MLLIPFVVGLNGENDIRVVAPAARVPMVLTSLNVLAPVTVRLTLTLDKLPILEFVICEVTTWPELNNLAILPGATKSSTTALLVAVLTTVKIKAGLKSVTVMVLAAGVGVL